MKHRLPLVLLVVLAVALSSVGSALGQTADPTLAKLPPDDLTDPPPLFTFEQYPPSVNDNLVLQWDEELLQAVRALPPGPTVTARAISVVHTAIFDAWAAYDARALGTRLGGSLRRPAAERTLANKNKAISFAAYTALFDLFPAREFDFAEQMVMLFGNAWASDTSPAAVVGITAAKAVLDYRHADGSNQLNGYADTTGYKPVNTGDTVVNPWRWQPIRVPLGSGPEQKATTPQWSKVKGFALKSPSQFTTPGPDRLLNSFDPKHIDNLLALTSNLSDRQKVTAEYWADGPKSEFPPGHWALIAQVLSRKRGHSLDTDAKLFFALGNALMDASIAAWAAKYRWDFVRPDHRHPPPLQGQAGHLLAGALPRLWAAGPRGAVDPLPGPEGRHPAVPRVRVRAQHLQLGRRGHPGQVHRQRQLRRQRDRRGGHLAVRAADRHPGRHPGHQHHAVAGRR